MKLVYWILMLLASIAVGAGYLYANSIAYNPRWIFSKYRKLRKYVVAQAKHETGNFESRVFLQNNNAFGMKNPFRRVTTSLGGDHNNYARYADVGDSLQDLFLWFDMRNFPTEVTSVDEYAFLLKSGKYFEDDLDNYSNGLRYWMNT